MNPFGTRGRAEELARLLDGATALPAPAGLGGAPVLVARLRATGASLSTTTVPRPEFKAALRTRLMAVAAVQAAQAEAGVAARPARALEDAVSWATGRRAAGVAAGAMASVVAVTGVAVAGSQSLPGDPFYGVKRTTEALQLATADGDVERGTRHLDFAATRLREVRGLALGRDAAQALPLSAGVDGAVLAGSASDLAAGAALGGSVAERVRKTLADMDTETRKGTELLTEAFRDSQQPEPLRALSRFATRQSDGLERLLPALPAATRDRARVSLALLTGVASETDELLDLGTCGPACDPSTSAPAPGSTTGTAPSTAVPGSDPCACEPQPTPAPSSATAPEPGTGSTPGQEPQPTASSTRRPAPSSTPQPSPSSGGGLPLPVPLPEPLPSLPLPEVPLPTLPEPVASLLPTLGPLQPLVDPLLPKSQQTPDPAPTVPVPTPVPGRTPDASGS